MLRRLPATGAVQPGPEGRPGVRPSTAAALAAALGLLAQAAAAQPPATPAAPSPVTPSPVTPSPAAPVPAAPVPAAADPAADVPRGAPELVRGRVVGDSARPLAGASVIVVRGPDRLTQQTTTDSAGRYAVRFADGTGDYLVTVSAPGYRTSRRRVQRQGGERTLVADFTLGRDLATLAEVRVRGERPARASNRITPTQLETGASERWRDGVEGSSRPRWRATSTRSPGRCPASRSARPARRSSARAPSPT
jgi:hypothetical protein